MANQILASDKIVRLNDFSLLGMVQSVNWDPNFNATDIFELGSSAKVDTALELETTGSLEIQSIGGTAGILARALVRRTASGSFLGYQYSGDTVKNAYMFTQADLVDNCFDLVQHERTDGINFNRSLVMPRCYLTSIAGRADANGVATETLNFSGDFVAGFPTPYHDVRVAPCIRLNAAAATIQGAYTSSTHTLAYFYVNERRLRTVAGDGIYATLSGAVVTVTGLTLSPSDILRAVVYVTPTNGATTFPSITSERTTSAFYVRGYQANIFLAPTDAASPQSTDQWLKVQSTDWNVDLRTESLRQIAFNAAGTSVFARTPTLPFTIRLNATVFEDDWNDWKKVLDPSVKTFAGTNIYTDSYDLAPTSLKSSFNIVVHLKTKTGTLLQEWRFTDMRVDGYGNKVNVGGRSELTWGFGGTAFTLIGYAA